MSKMGMPVPPPEEGPSKVEATGITIKISGPITKKTLEDFSKLDLNKYKKVELNSYGGDVDAGIAIAKAIRAKKMATFVPEKAICGSICTVIFQGGESRTVHERSILGYHSAKCPAPPMFQKIADRVCSDQSTEKVSKVMEELNLSVRISRTLHEVPFESAKCLTRDEANNLNADNRDKGFLDGIDKKWEYKKPSGSGLLEDIPAGGSK